ncbi:MAG: hypothetical protein VX252_07585 [Myxococcota bacterium]|nr:hypothetical protein [Myxococcota bacterium]
MSESNQRAENLGHPIWLYLGLTTLILAFGFPLCVRGINLADEGYMLQQSLDLLQGQVIYRDMDSFVAPGMWFLLAGTFKTFGASVFVSRMLMLGVFLGLGLTGYRIVAPLAGWRYGFATVLSLLLFSVWAFPTWTFAFYSPVAVLLILLALERLLAWQRSHRNLDLALTGIFLGLAICFKQNYGVFATIGAALGYLVMNLENRDSTRKKPQDFLKEIGLVAISMVAAGLPFLGYFLANGAVEEAWLSLVVHPFEFAGRHDIPYAAFSNLWTPDLYNTSESRLTYLSFAKLNTASLPFLQSVRFAERMHVLLYWIAPLVIILGLLLSILRGLQADQRIHSASFTCFAVSGFVFLGVFPRADFNHLVNVYQPIIVSAPLTLWLTLHMLGPHRPWLRRFSLLAVSIFALAYGSIALHWYAGLYERMNTRLEMPRAGVEVSAQEARHIEFQVRAIQERSNAGDAVLTIPDLTMLNFLSERRVPSKWYNLYEHHIAADRGQGVADQSRDQEVELIMTRFDNFFSDRVGLLEYAPYLSNHVITQYERDFIGHDENFIVYRKRAVPENETPFTNALMDCHSESGMSEIRNHLLFSALYHKSHPLEPLTASGISTRCRIRVPDGASVLSLEMGYRKPSWVEPGSVLDFTISIVEGNRSVSILEEKMRVVPKLNAIRQQPFRRFDLDLQAWAGQEIELEFETRIRGSVRNHGGDLRGFAAVYRDARIQARPDGARP